MQKTNQRPCDECSAAYEANRRTQRFCSNACAKTWNNRAAMRGATLYNLAMTDYCDRQHPRRKNGDIQKAIRRLLSRWRDDDKIAGRAVAMDIETLLENDMTLTANYVHSSRNPWA